MPTYEYACRDCGEHLEVVQSFKDDPLEVCPACEGQLRKVFSAAGIVFKGSGWHIKDYGTSGGSSAPAADTSASPSTSSDASADSASSSPPSDTPSSSSDSERKSA